MGDPLPRGVLVRVGEDAVVERREPTRRATLAAGHGGAQELLTRRQPRADVREGTGALEQHPGETGLEARDRLGVAIAGRAGRDGVVLRRETGVVAERLDERVPIDGRLAVLVEPLHALRFQHLHRPASTTRATAK